MAMVPGRSLMFLRLGDIGVLGVVGKSRVSWLSQLFVWHIVTEHTCDMLTHVVLVQLAIVHVSVIK